MKKIFPLLLLFQSCLGWGDVVNKPQKIDENYFLFKNEAGHYDIAYKDNDVYVLRNPANSGVIAYATNDSFLVMKIRTFTDSVFYYVINKKKDGSLARSFDYEVPVAITDENFQTSWLSTMNLRFKELTIKHS